MILQTEAGKNAPARRHAIGEALARSIDRYGDSISVMDFEAELEKRGYRVERIEE